MPTGNKKIVDLKGLGAEDAIRMLACATRGEMKHLEQLLHDHTLNVACLAKNPAKNTPCAARDLALNVACAAQNLAMNIACAAGQVNDHIGRAKLG